MDGAMAVVGIYDGSLPRYHRGEIEPCQDTFVQHRNNKGGSPLRMAPVGVETAPMSYYLTTCIEIPAALVELEDQ